MLWYNLYKQFFQLRAIVYRVVVIILHRMVPGGANGGTQNMNVNMNVSVIGGADGPTSIYLSEQFGPSWINIFGIIIVILMLLPNIIYAIKFRGVENKCKNKIMNRIEQIGRYASMFFLMFHVGLVTYGFPSATAFIIYFIGNTILLIAYWFIWLLYFKKMVFWKSMALAILPTMIFLVSGITLRHYFLVLSAIVFGIGHFYVTYQNAK